MTGPTRQPRQLPSWCHTKFLLLLLPRLWPRRRGSANSFLVSDIFPCHSCCLACFCYQYDHDQQFRTSSSRHLSTHSCWLCLFMQLIDSLRTCGNLLFFACVASLLALSFLPQYLFVALTLPHPAGISVFSIASMTADAFRSNELVLCSPTKSSR